jgi:serine/threonine protein kinase
LPEEQVRDYARQLSSGLTYLHRHNIVHRDIKPDNILLDNENNVYLSDFGVSEMLDSEGDGTVTGSQGTPAFFSPELCRGEGSVHGKAVDVWALGVTLYVLLFGKLPFFGESVDDILNNIQNISLEFPQGVDPGWKNLLLQMLNKDPNKRITALDLKHHATLVGPVVPTSSTTSETSSPSNVSSPPMVANRRRRMSDFDLLTIDENDLNNAITIGAGISLRQTPHDHLMKFVERVRNKVHLKKMESTAAANAAAAMAGSSIRRPVPPSDELRNSSHPQPRSRHSASMVRIDVPADVALSASPHPPDVPQTRKHADGDDAISRFANAVKGLEEPMSANRIATDEDE